ncbi:MAG: hypothetical protein JWQ33_1805 [Ramlibacter sp.]|nr:hypothetical protein [Ramlibacter sp.]
MVVLEHAALTYSEKVGASSTSGVFALGDLGVKLFFCISGYIIYKSAGGLEPGPQSASFFARRRLIRIAPLYWCVTLIYAAKLGLQGALPDGRELAWSLLFIPYANSTGLMRPVLGQGWTLNFEMFFYLFLGLSLFLAKHLRLVAVCGLLLLLMGARHVGLVVPGEGSGFGPALYLLASENLLFFMAGMCIAALEKTGATALVALRWETSMLISATLILVFVAAGPAPFGASFIAELALCASCVAVCVMARSEGEQGRTRRCLLWSGDASYTTYLTHGFVMGPAARIVGATGLEVSPWMFCLCMLIVCTGVGMVVYRLVEHPLMVWMNAHWCSSRPARAHQVGAEGSVPGATSATTSV